MFKKIIYSALFFWALAWGQNSKFKEFNIVVYPEYYFPGIMVEIDGITDSTALPFEVEIAVPANTDSVFFISGAESDENAVFPVVVQTADDRHYIHLNLIDTEFRAFVFYNMDVNGDRRSGKFTMQVSENLEKAHLIIQQPIVAENWSYFEKDSDVFQDQHGVTFHRLHLHDYQANTVHEISFSYSNPSGKTSMIQLQAMLSGGGTMAAPQNARTTTPVRHNLPQWQPLAILAVLAVVVGLLFSRQRRQEGSRGKPKGKFCTSCGHPLEKEDKFCSNCGAKQ